MKSIIIPALALSCSMLLYTPGKAQCTASGYNGGSTFSTSGGGTAWSNPSNAQFADGSVASVSVSLGAFSTTTTNYLVATNFGFAIPNASTVCGITVQIKRYGTGLALGTVKDNSVMLVQGGAISGSDLASGANWTGLNSFATYGSTLSTWGLTWLPADINSSGFGVAISAKMSTIIGIAMSTDVDYIQITVSYNTTLLALAPINFTLHATEQGNLLSWTAPSDPDATNFTVQRSAASDPSAPNAWQDLATLPAINVPQQQNYTYTDANPAPGANAYRLMIETARGARSYTTVHVISGSSTLTNLALYPNPAANTLHISGPNPIHSIKIIDPTGRLLGSIDTDGSPHSLDIPVAALRPGLYLLQVDRSIFKWLKN